MTALDKCLTEHCRGAIKSQAFEGGLWVSHVHLMVPYTLVFSRCIDGQYFNFFTNLAYNFILEFYENRFISAMIFASCVNAIIETFYDIYFNTFALNAFAPAVFRALGKQLPHFLLIHKFPVAICWWSLSTKSEPSQLHDKRILSWRETVTSRLEMNLLN